MSISCVNKLFVNKLSYARLHLIYACLLIAMYIIIFILLY